MNDFQQVAVTQDGRGCFSGVFHFYETHGVPLTDLFSLLNERNMLPDWLSFCKEALDAGMKPRGILSMIDEATLDVWGKEFRDVVMSKLEYVFSCPKYRVQLDNHFAH